MVFVTWLLLAAHPLPDGPHATREAGYIYQLRYFNCGFEEVEITGWTIASRLMSVKHERGEMLLRWRNRETLSDHNLSGRLCASVGNFHCAEWRRDDDARSWEYIFYLYVPRAGFLSLGDASALRFRHDQEKAEKGNQP